jgi:hypothetical protein
MLQTGNSPEGRIEMEQRRPYRRVRWAALAVVALVGCTQVADIGARVFVPCTTVYVFYRPGGC